MSLAEMTEFSEIMKRIEAWEPARRLTLVRRVLENLETSIATPSQTPAIPRGRSAAEIQAQMKTDRPAPDDETVRQWIDEYRMEKYGR